MIDICYKYFIYFSNYFFIYFFPSKGEKVVKKTKMLKKNYEFKNVLSKGKFFKGKFITLVVLDNNKKINYLGLAISSKAGKAVKRNRIKRYLRESYYFFEDDLNIGKSIVFLLNKGLEIDNINFLKIKNDMNNLFIKANIFENR